MTTESRPPQCDCCDEGEGCNEPEEPMDLADWHEHVEHERAMRRAEDAADRELMGYWDE